jgi:CCR4-NOT transcriptional regulation complex NOT5 subunit
MGGQYYFQGPRQMSRKEKLGGSNEKKNIRKIRKNRDGIYNVCMMEHCF